MGRRYRVNNKYVVRDKEGRFKRWSNIGRSARQDARKDAKTQVKPGYGHRGDIAPKTQMGFCKRVYNKFKMPKP